MSEATTCYVRDCDRDAKKAGLCWGHYKRRQLKKTVSVELEERRTKHGQYDSPYGRCLVIAFEFSELSATDKVGWDRLHYRFRKALDAYSEAKKRGTRPPASGDDGATSE